MEYISADVTNQKMMWDIAEKIGDKEGRVDICIAGAAILGKEADCLEYSDENMQQVMAVNVNGALYTAQAAGRQMTRGSSSLIPFSSFTNTALVRRLRPSRLYHNLWFNRRFEHNSRPKMGRLQCLKMCNFTDGPQYGMRAGY